MQGTNPPSITSQELLALAQAAHGSGDPETRWDLFWVQDEHGDFRQGGAYLRDLARHYSTRLVPTKRNSAPQNAPTQEAPLQVPLFME